MTTAPLPGCSRSLAEAREEEVKQLEEKVAETESRLLEELEQFRGDARRPKTPQAWAPLSNLESGPPCTCTRPGSGS